MTQKEIQQQIEEVTGHLNRSVNHGDVYRSFRCQIEINRLEKLLKKIKNTSRR